MDEEINLNYLLNIVKRNKKLIGIFALLFFAFSYIFAKTSSKIWLGQFQIVLNKEKQNPVTNLLKNNDGSAMSLVSGLSNKDSLLTELAILESPLVLMPTFDFVKSYKEQYNKNSIVDFNKWRRKNLRIELKRGTSVLDFSYKDKDKNLILSVLEEVSKTYQEYSGKSKKKNLVLVKDYLNSQIESYKIKSSESFRVAQEFANQQDLIIFQSDNSLDKQKNPNSDFSLISSNVEIESVRVREANKIRSINSQIEKIKNISDDKDSLQYIGSTIPGLVKTGLPDELENIESELANLKRIYTEKDKSIIKLKRKRETLINLLRERAIGYLKAEKLTSESIIESTLRPKGVLIKYKELIREASRDEKTLINLENQLNMISLEEARTEPPWELITKPTLLQFPVAPQTDKIVLIGTFLGIIIGYMLSIYLENKKGLIYEKKIIEKILNTNIIEEINLETNTRTFYPKDILENEILQVKNKKIQVILSEEINPDILSRVLDLIFSNKESYQIIQNFAELDNKIYSLILVNSKYPSLAAIKRIKERLSLKQHELFGIILIN